MARRPRLLLLDAGAVFGALEHQAWQALVDGYELVIPKIVLAEIQFYVSRETGERVEIDTQAWIDAGAVVAYEASATELADTLRLINRPDGPEIHEGEALRCVFADTPLESQPVRRLLVANLDSGILGERYHEDAIRIERGLDHFDLLSPHVVNRYLREIIEAL